MLAVVISLSCGGDDGPSPLDQRLEELTATWSLNSVTNDNLDVTSQFTGFTLTVTGNQTYSTTNGGNAWPASGTFEVLQQNLDILRRDDNVEVNIVSITDTALVLSFNVNSVRGSAHGITGSFVFNLNKTN